MASAILGGEQFVRQALKRLKGETVASRSSAHRREIAGRVDAEEILRAVGEQYGVSREELLKRGQGESRMVAMHLLKAHTGMTNGGIGELCGGISYSAVSQAHRRCAARARVDGAFAKRMAAIEKRLSHVKVCPQRLFEDGRIFVAGTMGEGDVAMFEREGKKVLQTPTMILKVLGREAGVDGAEGCGCGIRGMGSGLVRAYSEGRFWPHISV